MDRYLSKCPFCNSNRIFFWGESTDKISLHKTWSRCSNCKLVFANPLKSKEEIKSFYENSYYKNISTKNDNNDTLKLYDWIYELIGKFDVPLNNILEIGCGRGYFLNYLCSKKQIALVNGIEFDPDVTNKINLPCYSTFYNSYFEDTQFKVKFDFIQCWHVIEHAIDINLFVAKISENLAKDGVAIIGTPTYGLINYFKSFLQRFFGLKMTVGTSSDHTYFFSKNILKKIIEQNGLHILYHKVYLDNINGELSLSRSFGRGFFMNFSNLLMRFTGVPLIGKQILIAKKL